MFARFRRWRRNYLPNTPHKFTFLSRCGKRSRRSARAFFAHRMAASHSSKTHSHHRNINLIRRPGMATINSALLFLFFPFGGHLPWFYEPRSLWTRTDTRFFFETFNVSGLHPVEFGSSSEMATPFWARVPDNSVSASTFFSDARDSPSCG